MSLNQLKVPIGIFKISTCTMILNTCCFKAVVSQKVDEVCWSNVEVNVFEVEQNSKP